MAYRINERNTGNINLEGGNKKRTAITLDDKLAIAKVLKTVYNAMEFCDQLDNYTDGGRILLMLDGTEMSAIRVMVRSLTGETVDKNFKY